MSFVDKLKGLVGLEPKEPVVKDVFCGDAESFCDPEEFEVQEVDK